MTTKIFSTPAQQQPCLLSADQLADPIGVIKEHFQKHTLADHRQLMWTILSAAITSDINNTYDATDVGEWVLYVRELEELLEAAWATAEQASI